MTRRGRSILDFCGSSRSIVADYIAPANPEKDRPGEPRKRLTGAKKVTSNNRDYRCRRFRDTAVAVRPTSEPNRLITIPSPHTLPGR